MMTEENLDFRWSRIAWFI